MNFNPRPLGLSVFIAATMAAAVTSAASVGSVAGGPSLAGKLLVATAGMADPRFQRTVIFMLKHDASGAMGLVVNRVLVEGSTESLLKMFGIESENSGHKIRVYYGGPVEPKTGFVLLFDREYSTKWRRAMAKRGIDL